MSTPVRVLLVDDDALVRAGLRYMLGATADVEVVGEAADGDEVPDAVRATRPDVILMDLRMARVDGVRATELVRAAADAPQVVVLTTFDTDEEVLGALRAGAAGYLLKDTPPEDLVHAVRTVATGEGVLSPSVTRQVITLLGTAEDRSAQRRAADQLTRLSDSERAVARAVATGKSNTEIAAALHFSPATVKAYISRALTKLELSNRVQLALIVFDADRTEVRP